MSVLSTNDSAKQAVITGQPLGGDTRFKSALRNRGKLYLILYLLLLPTFVGMVIFNYTPKWQEVVYSFFKWDGQFTLDFIGWDNYAALFNGGDPLFWPTFQLVGVLLVANLVKMWPSIFAAIVLHRIRSERWQYLYRVLFVVPMVIPGLVWLLIWKNFFDANIGLLNRFLNATGLMHVLNWMDTAMPALAKSLQPAVDGGALPIAGSVWGILMLGAIILTMQFGLRSILKGWVWWVILLLVSWAMWFDRGGPLGLGFRFMASWALCLAAGQGLFLLGKPGKLALRWIGGLLILAGCVLVLGTMVWHTPINAFKAGSPSWLSHAKLVIPSLIIWGFPWVGTVGVLIYLAGLQQISNDVYEAAEIDGVTSLGKALKIELPLMMTQVRINLIFMTIGTLNDYGLVLLLLGNNGGPDSVGMTPGLYMYRRAFLDGQFGYACALGMVLFALILLITIIYQKYVKVEK
jgi:ABC-type sugar transport system permease subunit